MYFNGETVFPRPSVERIISEAQILFAFLFVLVAITCYVDYPLPQLPGFLGTASFRLSLIVGFVLVCLISVRLERKHSFVTRNPIQDLAFRRQKQANSRYDLPNQPPADLVSRTNLHPRGTHSAQVQ